MVNGLAAMDDIHCRYVKVATTRMKGHARSYIIVQSDSLVIIFGRHRFAYTMLYHWDSVDAILL